MTPDARIKHMLYMLMTFDIHRYLMSNTKGRLDGSEKADRHLSMTYTYIATKVGLVHKDMAPRLETDDGRFTMIYTLIHDATQELTDYMDEVIGFPIDDTRPDYDTLAPKFFKEFILLAELEWDRITDVSNGPGIRDGRWNRSDKEWLD